MRTLFFVSIFLLCRCENPPANPPSEKALQAVCNCTAQLLALNQRAAESPETADFQTIELEFGRAKYCVGNLLARGGKTKKQAWEALEKDLGRECPDLMAQRELIDELLAE
jgi:hypothetical protein